MDEGNQQGGNGPMKRFGMFVLLALVAVVAAGCMGSSDRSTRQAAIGSSTPVPGAGSMASPALLNNTAIRVDSWNWGIENTASIGGTTGGATSGRATGNRFTVQKNIDDSSNQLFIAAARSTNLQTLTFKVGTTLTYTFSNPIIVTSVKHSGEGTGGGEEVEFVYGKVAIQNSTNPSKPSTAAWDFIQNTGG
jgi:type VI protein secretion system component Hcp